MNDTKSTRDRIIEAAFHEFAAFGIAGSRIERIAKTASTSKERIYAHFRSKKALYNEVAASEMENLVKESNLDPEDLPSYAGRVFDYFAKNQESYKLLSWGNLENGNTPQNTEKINSIITEKIQKIKKAQEDGFIDKGWDPIDILAIVGQLSTTWFSQTLPRHSNAKSDEEELKFQRQSIISAVQILFKKHTPEIQST